MSASYNYDSQSPIKNKPYRFIPFIETKNYKVSGKLTSGTINITIEPLTPLHVSVGEYMYGDNLLYKSFFNENGRYAIPGTSVKGMVRSLAEIVSHSCATMANNNYPSLKHKERMVKEYVNGRIINRETCCIICDMFGKMGKSSKVKFTHFAYVEGTGERTFEAMPQLWTPRTNESIYKGEDGKFLGYKLYRHGTKSCLKKGDINNRYNYECFGDGALFKGSVIYRNLDKEELNLLCFALGLSGDFNHKLGYGKPAYYGSIKITTEQKQYIDCARQYKADKKVDSQISKNIDLLGSLYKYEPNKKAPDYQNSLY